MAWPEPLAGVATYERRSQLAQVIITDGAGHRVAGALGVLSRDEREAWVGEIDVDPDGAPTQRARAFVMCVRKLGRLGQDLGVRRVTYDVHDPAILGTLKRILHDVPDRLGQHTRLENARLFTNLLERTDEEGRPRPGH
jgi:hypothetical protein